MDEYVEKICADAKEIDVRLREYVNELLTDHDPRIVSYDLACALIDVCKVGGMDKSEFLKGITVLAELIYAIKQ